MWNLGILKRIEFYYAFSLGILHTLLFKGSPLKKNQIQKSTYLSNLKWLALLLGKLLELIARKVAVGRMEELEGKVLIEKHLY